MDTITHSLAGAVIGYALGSKKENSKYSPPAKVSVLCGAIVAAFPDIDYVTALIDPLLFITYWHRGITHSLVMLPIWAFGLGMLIAILYNRLNQWKAFVTFSAVILLSHILLDITTSWNTQIFAPLTDYRVSLRYVFIIDPIVTGIVLISLISTVYFRTRWLSLFGIATLVFYIFGLSVLQHNAVKVAKNHTQQHDWVFNEIVALPQPFSPFNWKLIVSDDVGYRVALLNLVRQKTSDIDKDNHESLISIRNYYRPKHNLDWKYYPRFGNDEKAAEVWMHPDFYLFRKFAHYPVVGRVDNSETEICYWYFDLRFLLPVKDTPFQYGMCKDHIENADWKLYRIKNFSNQKQEFVNSRLK